ncbi:MAG: helix-turn-helix transcriptional regulator [Lachnospiraceae bacterium]|nr:helix-turn-helix transcriptional regulator [Lachnospiraceae bacterium]
MSCFGGNFKKLRKDKEMSQEQMAELLNIADRSTISRWENGSVEPDLDTLIQVAKFFDVSLDELVVREYETETLKNTLEMVQIAIANAISQYGDLKSISKMTIEELADETAQRYFDLGEKFAKEERYQSAIENFEKAGILGKREGYYYAIPLYEKMADYYFGIDEVEEGAWCHQQMELCEMKMMEME